MDTLLPPARPQLPWRRPRIAILEITGAIGVQVRGPDMVRTIRALADDPRVRAVVIDIDSPGGSAPVSDAIHRAVRRLSARKPTVAFVMNGALSGGYLIASAASRIVALPTAMVGSIGVIFMRPVVQELMDRLGVKMVITHKGKLKAMFQPWREPTPEEQQKVESLTGEYYDWFVEAVARTRNLPIETVRGLATGELFSAKQGKDLGLVDELGDFDTALDIASEMSKTPRRLQWVRPRRPLLERLLGRAGASLTASALATLEGRLYPRIDLR